MQTSNLQKLLFWISVFLHFPCLFFSLSFHLLFFSFIFILHLLHSRTISICCSLWEREREREREGEIPNSCTRFAIVSQKIISSSQGQLTDLWVGVVWRKERRKIGGRNWEKNKTVKRGRRRSKEERRLRQGWLKKTAQKTNAKSKSHAEMCPSKLRRGALTILTLLTLLSSFPSTKENWRAACNEVKWDERQPHACKLSQFSCDPIVYRVVCYTHI